MCEDITTSMLARSIRRFFALLLFVCATKFSAWAETNAISVQTHTNKETSYTQYRFAVVNQGEKIDWDLFTSKIEWDVIEHVGSPKPKKHLIVHQSPGAASFSANAPIHRALMKRIFSQWPISDFDGVSFGSLGGAPDWSWSIAIAVESSKSHDYKDYKVNYPNSKLKGLNGLFVNLANDGNAYAPIREVFKEFGVDVRLVSAEKVIHAKAEELPFYRQLRAKGIAGKTRVIHDALGNGFSIEALNNKASAENDSSPTRPESNQTSDPTRSDR